MNNHPACRCPSYQEKLKGGEEGSKEQTTNKQTVGEGGSGGLGWCSLLLYTHTNVINKRNY